MPSTTGPSTRNAATTLDRYFTLSDTAGHSQTDFEELIGLFAPDAVLEPATGPSVRGAAQIAPSSAPSWTAMPNPATCGGRGSTTPSPGRSPSSGPWRSGAQRAASRP